MDLRFVPGSQAADTVRVEVVDMTGRPDEPRGVVLSLILRQP